MQCSAVQCSAAQCSTAQCSAAHCPWFISIQCKLSMPACAVQYSRVQYSTECAGWRPTPARVTWDRSLGCTMRTSSCGTPLPTGTCLGQDSYQSLVWDSSLSSVSKGYIQEHHDRQNNVIFVGTVHKLIISRFSTL